MDNQFVDPNDLMIDESGAIPRRTGSMDKIKALLQQITGLNSQPKGSGLQTPTGETFRRASEEMGENRGFWGIMDNLGTLQAKRDVTSYEKGLEKEKHDAEIRNKDALSEYYKAGVGQRTAQAEKLKAEAENIPVRQKFLESKSEAELKLKGQMLNNQLKRINDQAEIEAKKFELQGDVEAAKNLREWAKITIEQKKQEADEAYKEALAEIGRKNAESLGNFRVGMVANGAEANRMKGIAEQGKNQRQKEALQKGYVLVGPNEIPVPASSLPAFMKDPNLAPGMAGTLGNEMPSPGILRSGLEGLGVVEPKQPIKITTPKGNSGTAPQAPTGKIRVKRKADGQTGTIDAADFNPDKYERIS